MELPRDPVDWTDEHVAHARMWDPSYRRELAAYERYVAEGRTNATELAEERPNTTPAESTDNYDDMSIAELKSEVEARELSLPGDADGRRKQPWIDVLRADDAAYVDLPDSHGDR